MKHLNNISLINITRLFIFIVCTTSISACDTKRQNDVPEAGTADSLNFALNNVIEKNIVPAISTFKEETDLLQTNATTFCASLNQANLTALQAQWKMLSLQWHRVVMYNLGPLNDDLIFPVINFIESMRQHGTNYTNTVRGELAARLSDATTLNQTYFDSLSFTRVGILALEVLIFEDSNGVHSTDTSLIVSDYQANSRKCDYLTGMIQLLSRHANTLNDGWQINFSSTGKPFKEILLKGELENGAESVPALITAIQKYLDYLKKRKLEVILDAQIADFFYQNISSALNEIEKMLQGSGADDFRFFDQMISIGFIEQVNIVKSNLAKAKQAALNENRSELTTAIGLLDGNFKREIPDGLNVTLGINFSDGD